MRAPKLLVGGLALAVALVYPLYASFLWYVQDMILFHPPPHTVEEYDAEAARAGIEPFRIDAEDGVELYGWHARGTGDRALIYFHGNGGSILTVDWLKRQLPGVDVLSISYRGFTGSEGTPSEAGITLDAKALWKKVTQDLHIPAERIVIHGESLGGGVAIRLAEQTKPGGLILTSTFLGVDLLAAEKFWYPPTFLLNSPFRSRERAPGIRSPTLVIHGDQDTLIPVSHGQRMARLIPGAQYLEVVGGGHNEFLPVRPKVHKKWKAFVLGVLNEGVAR